MAKKRVDVKALHEALDAERVRRDISWRKLAQEADVQPSTLSRLANGKRPDVEGFAKLIQWLRLPAEKFLRNPDDEDRGKAERKEPSPVVYVSSYLRASKDLSEKSKDFLDEVFRAAYKQAKKMEED